ncbi:PREDICTED: transmembrane protein 14C [Dufourea novaeangliae]|uniref:transmembrane protein 14C n=1 Tax=Dufourea novaeangliae TaxID=178035 RepID=UPI000767A5A3|nr:PREDICTED: transmembrane protein 14C [Dufourea novaeangliae]
MPVDILAYTYAATVAAGGVLGFIKSNSIPSLGAGLFFGTILGYGAYQTSVDPTNVGVFLGASTTLGGVMGYRLYHSGKIMPAGVVTLFSVIMIVRTIGKYFTATSMKTQ